MTRIKNINQHPHPNCACGCSSWLEHWEHYGGGKRPTFCIIGAPDCLGKAEVGAFVQKANVTDGKWYLAPLCTAHSHNHDAEFSVYDTWSLVEVDFDNLVCLTKKKNEHQQPAIAAHTL